MEGQARIRKLRWQCRRGMKELDVLLEAFLARHEAELKAGGWPCLEEFLQEEDGRLWAWIQHKHAPVTARYRALVGALRERT